MALNLYRAVFQRPDSSLRPMTYAEKDDADAQRCADQWSCGDKLLIVRLERPLQAPLLVLS